MSNELLLLLNWENLPERARISESGRLARGYAKPQNPYKKGNPHSAYMFACMAAHDARLLFPELFLWEGERYGQQLKLEAA